MSMATETASTARREAKAAPHPLKRPPGTAKGTATGFSLPAGLLSWALSIVRRGVDEKGTIPIIGTVRFELTQDGLTLRSNDLDREISVDLPGEGWKPGMGFCIPTKAMAGILRHTDPAAEIEFRLKRDEHRVEIEPGFGSITYLPADDFPLMRLQTPDAVTTFAPGALQAAFAFCEDAMSDEEVRYYLRGVALYPMEIAKGKFEVMAFATDGHRLHGTPIHVSQKFAATVPIIPRRAVEDVLKVFKDSEIRSAINAQHITFTAGGISIASKRIDGSYPEVTRVIPAPDKAAHVFEIERDRLRAVLKTLKAGIRRRKPNVTMQTRGDGKELRLLHRDSETDQTFEQFVSINTVKGPRIEFGLNFTYLMHAVETMHEAERLRFEMSDSGSPIRIIDAEQDPLDRFPVIVIMPVRT